MAQLNGRAAAMAKKMRGAINLMERMRDKISQIEMELGITPPNTDEPEIFAGPFVEQEEDEGESSDGQPLKKDLTPTALQLITSIGKDIRVPIREKQSGEAPVFSSFVHHIVDDAVGFASGNVPLIPSLIRSESESSCPRTDSVKNGSFGLSLDRSDSASSVSSYSSLCPRSTPHLEDITWTTRNSQSDSDENILDSHLSDNDNDDDK